MRAMHAQKGAAEVHEHPHSPVSHPKRARGGLENSDDVELIVTNS